MGTAAERFCRCEFESEGPGNTARPREMAKEHGQETPTLKPATRIEEEELCQIDTQGV